MIVSYFLYISSWVKDLTYVCYYKEFLRLMYWISLNVQILSQESQQNWSIMRYRKCLFAVVYQNWSVQFSVRSDPLFYFCLLIFWFVVGFFGISWINFPMFQRFLLIKHLIYEKSCSWRNLTFYEKCQKWMTKMILFLF